MPVALQVKDDFLPVPVFIMVWISESGLIQEPLSGTLIAIQQTNQTALGAAPDVAVPHWVINR